MPPPSSTRSGVKRTTQVKAKQGDVRSASSAISYIPSDDDDDESDHGDSENPIMTRANQRVSHYFEETEVQRVAARAGGTKRKASSRDEAVDEGSSTTGTGKRRKVEGSSALASASASTSRAAPVPLPTLSDHNSSNENDIEIVAMPTRRDPNGHPTTYHHPLLLNNQPAREALLSWFNAVSSTRAMPWRKPWINPAKYTNNPSKLDDLLKKRAYEVWISEIMLQQTRVATVIDYWTKWMRRWPTIDRLAAAKKQNVLDAWAGLGYYNRATRLHEAAKKRVQYYGGMLPDDPVRLELMMEGVGKYTAGAISAIVFGRAVPLVDGNVLRVLSRQLGLFGDVQKDKRVVDRIWKAAGDLAKQVVRDERGDQPEAEEEVVDKGHANNFGLPLSEKPGQWGQALMELGSTVCTPKAPNCAECPISSTCRAYSEGFALAIHSGDITVPGVDVDDYAVPPLRQEVRDIEDLCKECDAEQENDVGLCADGNTKVKFKPKECINEGKEYNTTSVLTPERAETRIRSGRAFAMITHHVSKYPAKSTKKEIKEQESQVFALRRRSDGKYLVQQRPTRGLLANMWELPSKTFKAKPDTGRPRHATRIPPVRRMNAAGNNNFSFADALAMIPNAERHMLDEIIDKTATLVSPARFDPNVPYMGCYDDEGSSRAWDIAGGEPHVRHVGELGIVPWLFSHIKMAMYVQLYELDDQHPNTVNYHRWSDDEGKEKWLSPDEVDQMTMGTGMKKCWELVKQAEVEGW